jgi:hypothetical protein
MRVRVIVNRGGGSVRGEDATAQQTELAAAFVCKSDGWYPP